MLDRIARFWEITLVSLNIVKLYIAPLLNTLTNFITSHLNNLVQTVLVSQIPLFYDIYLQFYQLFF